MCRCHNLPLGSNLYNIRRTSCSSLLHWAAGFIGILGKGSCGGNGQMEVGGAPRVTRVCSCAWQDSVFSSRSHLAHRMVNIRYPDRNALFWWIFTCQDMTIKKVTVTPILRTWHCVPSHTDTQKTTDCNRGRRSLSWPSQSWWFSE